MLINKYLKDYFRIFLILISILFAFEINDENSIIYLKSGKKFVKYVSIVNFSHQIENISVELKIESWPDKKIPAYQINNLVNLKENNLTLKDNKKILFPVYIEAGRSLKKGRYEYWLIFNMEQNTINKEDVGFTENKTYNLPLIIMVQ